MKKIVLSFLIIFVLTAGVFKGVFSTINGENTIPQIGSLLGFIAGLGTAFIISLVGRLFFIAFPKANGAITSNLIGAIVALVAGGVFLGFITPTSAIYTILLIGTVTTLGVLLLFEKRKKGGVAIISGIIQGIAIFWVVTRITFL
jgi:hypothetical protein